MNNLTSVQAQATNADEAVRNHAVALAELACRTVAALDAGLHLADDGEATRLALKLDLATRDREGAYRALAAATNRTEVAVTTTVHAPYAMPLCATCGDTGIARTFGGDSVACPQRGCDA